MHVKKYQKNIVTSLMISPQVAENIFFLFKTLFNQLMIHFENRQRNLNRINKHILQKLF